MEKTCPQCNTTFRVKASHFDKRTYCSRGCMAQAYTERLKGKANPHYSNASKRVCEACGKEYQSYTKTRKFCSNECSARRPERIAQFRKNRRIRIAKKKYQQKVIRFLVDNRKEYTCPICGKQFKSYTIRTFCSKKCSTTSTRGHTATRNCVICGEVFSLSPSQLKQKTTCSRKCSCIRRSLNQQGDKSHRWQGGKTSQVLIIRSSATYKQWRSSVFARDDFTCQLCGVRGGKLSAHHIREFAKHHDLRFVPQNGITLCWPCHVSIKGKEPHYEAQFFAITGGLPEST